MITINDLKIGNTVWTVEENYDVVNHKITKITPEGEDVYYSFISGEDSIDSEWGIWLDERDLDEFYLTELEACEFAKECLKLKFNEVHHKKLKSLTEDKQQYAYYIIAKYKMFIVSYGLFIDSGSGVPDKNLGESVQI